MSRTLLALALVAGLTTAPAEARKRPKTAVKTQRTQPAKADKRTKRADPRKQSSAAVPPRTISSLRRQTSDPVIARDLAALDAWQQKLESLPGAADDVWRAAAARAWLEAGRVEYTDNDRQGFPQAAFERAVALITDIESGKAPVDSSNAPPASIPRGSTRLADSLYARLDSLKHNPGFRCARAPLAQLEVELAWAGNEQLDQGACHASPHLARAVELARFAQDAVEHCVPPPVAAKLEEPLPEASADTVTVIKPPVPTREELRIPRNVHFALGRFDIGATSQQVIGGIASLLDKYPSISVRLVGHTDSRGSPEYNLALSKRRVDAVRSMLVGTGIDPTRLTTDYRGKSELYAIEDSKRGFALNRRVEMVFVDSEGRDLKAEAQDSDLQIEAGRPKRRR